MPKRKAKEVSKLETMLSLAEELSPDELVLLVKKVREIQMGKPMSVKIPNKLNFLKGKFSIFNKGKSSDDAGQFPGVFCDTVHFCKLIWNDSKEELDLRLALQEGVMHAGTTAYEIQCLQVGPVALVYSFPEGSRLPSSEPDEETVAELIDLLKPHGITTAARFKEFLYLIMNDVLQGKSSRVAYSVDEMIDMFDEIQKNED